MSLRDFRLLAFALLLMPLFFGLIDVYNSRLTQYPFAISKYVNLTNSEVTLGLLQTLLFCIVASSVCWFFMRRWFESPFKIRRFNPKVINKVNSLIKYFIILVIIYKIFTIFQMGLLDFTIMARTGDMSLGHGLYFVLLMFPFILAYDISLNGFSLSNKLCLIALAFLNLATGFRILLISGLLVILFFNWHMFIKVKKLKILTIGIFFIVLLLGYEISRGILLESNEELSALRSSLDSLNRTSPINVMQLIEDTQTSPPSYGVLKLWTDPPLIVVESLGVSLENFVDTQFNLNEISTPLFSDFLAWRGTWSYSPSGFSISIVPYSYLYGRGIGIIVFAMFYGFFIAMGCKLISSKIYEWKLLGSALLVSSFMCNESIVESSKSLVFFLILIAIIFFIVIMCQKNRFSFLIGIRYESN